MGLLDIFCKNEPLELRKRDIHSHLLPGVDDGFRSQDESLEAIRQMGQAGVQEIVFTPHINPDVDSNCSEERLLEVYESFKPKAESALNGRVSLAAEYMVVNHFERRVSDHADQLLTFADKSILIEQSYYFPSQNLLTTIFELQMAGLRPILAHPERYLFMANDLQQFDRILQTGTRLQLNYLSLAGNYGPESQKIFRYLLKKHAYSFVSTDLHSLRQLHSIQEVRVSKHIHNLLLEQPLEN